MGRVGDVAVPTPKNLDLAAFKSEAAHQLHGLLPKLGLPSRTAEQLDDLVALLVENLASGSVAGQTLTRDGLGELLRGWISHSGGGVRILRVFVASTEDTKAERAVLGEVVASINRTEGDAHQVRLELCPPQLSAPVAGAGRVSSADPSAPGDLFVGVVSSAFGEGVAEAAFRQACERWRGVGTPWIQLYFDDQPRVPRNKREAYDGVCGFREQWESLGVVCGYTGVRDGEDSFHSRVSEHLRRTLPNSGWESGTAPFRCSCGSTNWRSM